VIARNGILVAAGQDTSAHGNLHLATGDTFLVLDWVGHLVDKGPRQKLVRHIRAEIIRHDTKSLRVIGDLNVFI
jgi:hypothetical protein